ncbi:hypothetical protein F5Y17DRAFT_401313 [Xylariaceae sp. FL0594]|nr:hypothetical protein F5Y17DRAFT_401313 [Xylariaceae sp. FL0594]
MGHREGLLAGAIVFLVLDSLAVFARLYVRTIIIKRGFGYDDFTLCLTYIGYVLSLGFGFTAMHYGYAAEDSQPWYNKAKATRFTYADQTSLYISAGLVKLAVALVLFRISVNKGMRLLLLGSMVVVGIWTIITVIYASWLCAKSGSSNWAGSETCSRVGYFRTISNIFIDYFYALLPIYILRGIQLKRKLKLIAIFLLSLGIFASSATIVKLVIIVRLNSATEKESHGLHYDLLLWANIELGLAIFAASAAALRPLLRHVGLIDGSVNRGSTNATDNGPYLELVVSRDANRILKDAGAAATTTTKVKETSRDPASSDEELFRVGA